MQFFIEGDLYKVARITGGSHNFLAIRFSDKQCELCVMPLPMKNNDPIRLHTDNVTEQIKRGLDALNEKEKKYFISEAHYIPSDTHSSSVYELLLLSLIERIESGAEFKKL